MRGVFIGDGDERPDPPATESLCPLCLRRIPAMRSRDGDDVYLVKSCPEHGSFKSIIWRGPPDYTSWSRAKPPQALVSRQTGSERGCPFDCGLCPEHLQPTCCVLLEVTSRCDLECPLCFASSGGKGGADPGLDEIESWFRLLRDEVGRCNIQLSGGEPTMRADLPRILSMGREMGFSFFQLNTNGLRLARERGYAGRLKDAGLSTVFLQFDGLDDRVYHTTRGRALRAQKDAAVAACADAGLGVVLVPTLVPGINISEIGGIVDYALERLPHVRGIHFQPVSYFGRYPRPPRDEDRYTLPELLRDLEVQTGGRIPADSLNPSGCGHSLCSVSGHFMLRADGSVRSLHDPAGAGTCCCGAREASDIERQRDFIARNWSPGGGNRGAVPRPGAARADRSAAAPVAGVGACQAAPPVAGGAASPAAPGAVSPPVSAPERGSPMTLDEFLVRARDSSFTITAMAFQDVWTLDLERLRNCHLHAVAPGGRIMPFCAYNLTDAGGRPLYRAPAAANAWATNSVDSSAGPAGREVT